MPTWGTDAPYQAGVQGHYARVCSEKSLHEPKMAERLPTILPLPGGEGWGEGERLAMLQVAGSWSQYASKKRRASPWTERESGLRKQRDFIPLSPALQSRQRV